MIEKNLKKKNYLKNIWNFIWLLMILKYKFFNSGIK